MSDAEKAPEAPSVIDDTLPGGPRWMHNLDDRPIWVETKTQLNEELGKRGLQLDVRDDHAKNDQSPWATKHRLRHDAVDPFLPVDAPTPRDEPEIQLPASTGMSETSTGTLGEHEVKAQAVQLTIDQLRCVREYARLITRANLESRLYCSQCFGGDLAHPCLVSVEHDKVFIVCDCTIRHGHAATNLPAPVTVPGRPYKELALVTVPQVDWPHGAAEIFRRYKKDVLLPLGLREALRCMDCYDKNQLDGCAARVTVSALSIECRCQHRVNTGISA